MGKNRIPDKGRNRSSASHIVDGPDSSEARLFVLGIQRVFILPILTTKEFDCGSSYLFPWVQKSVDHVPLLTADSGTVEGSSLNVVIKVAYGCWNLTCARKQ
jgi:hypothetical protein